LRIDDDDREDHLGVVPASRRQLGVQLCDLHAEGGQVQARTLKEDKAALLQQGAQAGTGIAVRVAEVGTKRKKIQLYRAASM
jgi:type II secretory pathway component PulM